MARRPKWRTPARKSRTDAPNAHLLPLVRTSFGVFTPGDGRTQCKAIARKTGVRCMCNAVQGAKVCRAHQGMHNLKARIKALGGPQVSKRSVPVGMTRRRIECTQAASLADLEAFATSEEKNELKKWSMSARGRILAKIASRRALLGDP